MSEWKWALTEGHCVWHSPLYTFFTLKFRPFEALKNERQSVCKLQAFISIKHFSFSVYHFKITRHRSVFTFWLLIIHMDYYFFTFAKYQLNLDLFIINYTPPLHDKKKKRKKRSVATWGESESKELPFENLGVKKKLHLQNTRKIYK